MKEMVEKRMFRIPYAVVAFIAVIALIAGSIPFLSSDFRPADNYSYRSTLDPLLSGESLLNGTEISTADAQDEFFGDTVHDIRITIDDEDWYDTLHNSHAYDTNDPYFNATFQCDGMTVDSVGLRMKGFTSFNEYPGDKKSFKLKFNEYLDQDFIGMRKLNLNNGYLDPTMLREKLLLDLAVQYIPTIRCTFAAVYINDEYFGLYTAVEQVDMTFILNNFGLGEDGNLFKGIQDCDLRYLGDDQDAYREGYSLKTNEDWDDYSELVRLTEVLSDPTSPTFQDELGSIFDVESWLYCLAIDNLFVNLDSYIGSAHNYYLYQSNNTEKFTHLIWDTNLAFGTYTKGMSEEEAENVTQLDLFWSSGSGDERPLVDSILSIPEYNMTYQKIVSKILRGGFDPDTFEERIEALSDLIRPYMVNDTKKQFSNNEFEVSLTDPVNYGNKEIPGLQEFVDFRYEYVKMILDEAAVPFDISLNELALDFDASSNGYDLVIELHNPGPGNLKELDLYITDDIDIKDKWQVPVTEMDAGEYLTFSMGPEILESLTDTDEGLILSYLDPVTEELVPSDLVKLPILSDEFSYGRYPDGVGEWIIFNDHQTPGEANVEDDLRVVINEFMAINDKTIRDPSDPGKTPDWLELYNDGNGTMDVSGYFLTDDITDPMQWKIPEGTIMGSGSFLMIWLDNKSDVDGLHVPFGLDSAGEKLYLISTDGMTVVDQLIFGEQFSDVSYGRIPDGGSGVEHLLIPTPGSSNSPNPDDNNDPVAYIAADLKVRTGDRSTIDGTSSQDDLGIAQYSWEIEHNGTSITTEGSTITYIFNSTGFYHISLTVTDSGGNTDTTSVDVLSRVSIDSDGEGMSSDQLLLFGVAVIGIVVLILMISKARVMFRFRKKGVFG